jgi:hypothetical protein
MHKTGDTKDNTESIPLLTDPNLSFCLGDMGRGISPLYMYKDIKQNRLCASNTDNFCSNFTKT